MSKKLVSIIMGVLVACMLTGCCISHDWVEATCTEPKTCTKCGETEGEALGHTWVEATCTEPKTCSVCGAIDGKALEHTWVDANYQQPKTCSVCGVTDGEPLEEQYEGEDMSELNKTYDLEVTCSTNKEKTTIGKVTFMNYEIFKSDEAHEAKDGYEWRKVDIKVAYGDDNTNEYGYERSMFSDDYYVSIDNPNEGHFTVSYNGKEYDECKKIYERVSESGWEKNEQYQEQYGWDGVTYTEVSSFAVLVPEGYDGFVCGVLDQYSINETTDEYERYVCFRMD